MQLPSYCSSSTLTAPPSLSLLCLQGICALLLLFSHCKNPPDHVIICFTRTSPPLCSPPPPHVSQFEVIVDLGGGRAISKRRLTVRLFGPQRREIVVWMTTKVRGHSLEGLRQKPDHNRGLIIMHCSWRPAGTPPSPRGHGETFGPPAVKTWWNTHNECPLLIIYLTFRHFGEQLTYMKRFSF